MRRAGSIRGGDAVGAWLHRVAHRAALRLDAREARRRSEERAAAAASARRVGPDARGRARAGRDPAGDPRRGRATARALSTAGRALPDGGGDAARGRGPARDLRGVDPRSARPGPRPAPRRPDPPRPGDGGPAGPGRPGDPSDLGRGGRRRRPSRRGPSRRASAGATSVAWKLAAVLSVAAGLTLAAAPGAPSTPPSRALACAAAEARSRRHRRGEAERGPAGGLPGRVSIVGPARRGGPARPAAPLRPTADPPRAVRRRRLLSLRGARRGGPQGVRQVNDNGWFMGSIVAQADGFAAAWESIRTRPGVGNSLALGRTTPRTSAWPRTGRSSAGSSTPGGGRRPGRASGSSGSSPGRREMGVVEDGLRNPAGIPFAGLYANDGNATKAYGIDTLIPPVTTDSEGRFRLGGVGRDRVLTLGVDGPGIVATRVDVLNCDGVDESTRDLRARFPHKPMPDGYTPEMRWQWQSNSEGLRIYGPTPADRGRPGADGRRDRPRRRHRGAAGRDLDLRTEPRADGRRQREDRRPRTLQGRPLRQRARILGPGRHRVVPRGALPLGRPEGRRRVLLGEVAADLTLRRGVVVTGRVVESGTAAPAVSAPSKQVQEKGARYAGYLYYRPLANNALIRGTPTGDAFLDMPNRSRPEETLTLTATAGSVRSCRPGRAS